MPMVPNTHTRLLMFAPSSKRIAKRRCTCAMLLAVLFALTLALPAEGQSFQMLYEFPLRKTGNTPSGLLGVNGNFYGTTALGGVSNEGTVFQLTSQGKLTSLYSFSRNTTDGRNPTIGPLIRDRAGNLYGTTQNGGDLHCVAFTNSPGCGTVFKLSAGGKETIVHSFSGGPTDGAYPLAGLVADSAGNLYGTTELGGMGCNGQGCGTVYKITPSGTETVLYSFTGGADGSDPGRVVLVIDPAGNLYGTAGGGGNLTCGVQTTGCGVVFKIDPTGKETVLHAFTGGADGSAPGTGVVRDSNGNLYGTVASGGNCRDCGLVFKIDPAGNETVLHSFTEEEVQPALQASTLLLDPAGNLYGTTLYGGSLSDGTVFEVSSQGVYAMLHSFDVDDGLFPVAGLIRDNAGNLYGATSQGGNFSCSMGCGVIFKITP
jgi:uncharacterized repeat protein (TIGR03803 family)